MATFKAIVLFLHRWLGLISGVVVLIVSVTGCLFVFQHEFSQWIRNDVLYVAQPGQQTLPIKDLQHRAAQALGVEYLPYGITTYKDPNRTWSAMYYKGGADSWSYFGTIEDYRTVYIDPYTGEVPGIVNEEQDFFQIVKGIHWSLLLSTPIGQPIVVWSTVIFIVLLFTGLVLWWPKKWDKSNRKKSFKIKWNAKWKRLNYDLHNVLGFYTLILALIVAITGLYWMFPFAQKGLYFLGTGEFKLPPPETEIVRSAPIDNQQGTSPLTIAYQNAWAKYPQAYSISLTAPVDSLGTIHAYVRPDGETYYEASALQFDQYTGKLLHEDPYSEQNAGEKLLSMNYDIHVGAIGGLFGKILAFLVSLVCASLPVTGFYIWWAAQKKKGVKNKRKKKRKTIQKIRSEIIKDEVEVMKS